MRIRSSYDPTRDQTTLASHSVSFGLSMITAAVLDWTAGLAAVLFTVPVDVEINAGSELYFYFRVDRRLGRLGNSAEGQEWMAQSEEIVLEEDVDWICK